MQVLSARYGLPMLPESPLRPLDQLRCDMVQAMQLAAAVQRCTSPYLPQTAIQTEMQVAVILAHMEVDGMGAPSATGHVHCALSPCCCCVRSLPLHLPEDTTDCNGHLLPGVVVSGNSDTAWVLAGPWCADLAACLCKRHCIYHCAAQTRHCWRSKTGLRRV